MRNYFIFDGVDSRTFGLYINGHKTFDSPERRYNLYQVPGRNGSIANDEHAFENVDLKYENSFIFENFEENYSRLTNFLLSRSGYCRLKDSYNPDEYRMAIFRKAVTPAMNDSNEVGVFDLIFECQPQRFLDYGDTAFVHESFPFTINNPTMFASKPIIRVYGDGQLNIGQYRIEIAGSGNFTDIDCNIMDCYEGSNNRNSIVTVRNHEFPVLVPGNTRFSLVSSSGGYINTISRVDVTPRWYNI